MTISRALAGRPRLVWADESTGALDSESAAEVMDLLCELQAGGMPLMLVTHDPAVGARPLRWQASIRCQGRGLLGDQAARLRRI